MKIVCCHCVLLLSLLGIFTLAGPLWAEEEKGSTMKIKPASTDFVQGEPLQFFLTFTNQRAMPVRVSLGSDGLENLRVTLTQDGESEVVAASVRSGITKPVALEVPPNGIASHSFFLEDFVRLGKPGAYRISVQIVGADVPPATTEFRIVPNTENYRSMLESHYAEMRKEMVSPDCAPQTRSDMRKALLLSRHSLALQEQQVMLSRRDWQAQGELEELVDAMVSSGSLEALQSLVNNILANPESSPAEKSVALNRLREAHVEKWHGPAYELLIPYLKDIETSAPTVISD